MIAVVILLGIMIFSISSGGTFISNIIGFLTTPMQKISSNATDSVTEFLDLDSLTKEELKAMYQELSEEARELREKVVELENLKNENESLRGQLELTEENDELEYLAASVVGRDPNDDFYSFSIDKGYMKDVSLGDPVITKNGLVGTVTEVYATTSVVTCVLSEDVSVAALIYTSETDNKTGDTIIENAVITGDIVMASDGTLKLEYLSNTTSVKEGDIVTTSGASGRYPKDIIIGRVSGIYQSQNNISKYAVIQPFEDLKNVKDVFVITGFPGKDEDTADITYDSENGDKEDGEVNP